MNNMVRAIIVEDEEPACKELKYILEQTGKIQVMDCASDGSTAFKKIFDMNPDVVFMDIQIPGMNGMDVAEKLKAAGVECMFVFATAYDEHAIKAFEMNAIDYVLKPYSEDRICITVNRILEKLNANSEIEVKIDRILSSLDNTKDNKSDFCKIPCDHYGRIILVDENDIVFCFIENEQTYVKTGNKKHLTNHTLHELEYKGNFFRVHRSYLVNLNKIKELYPWFHGTYKIIMIDDEKTEIPVSRNNVKKLKDTLGI